MKLALSLSKSNACRDMDCFLSFLAWTVSMDHLNLIGISRGGLDQPKEIHRVWEIIYATINRESRSSSSQRQGVELLDLVGTSRDVLDHPQEIHGVDDNGGEQSFCVFLFSSDLGRKKSCGNCHFWTT
ncbi:unnamed protein product [Malus baccata var. baccata]